MTSANCFCSSSPLVSWLLSSCSSRSWLMSSSGLVGRTKPRANTTSPLAFSLSAQMAFLRSVLTYVHECVCVCVFGEGVQVVICAHAPRGGCACIFVFVFARLHGRLLTLTACCWRRAALAWCRTTAAFCSRSATTSCSSPSSATACPKTKSNVCCGSGQRQQRPCTQRCTRGKAGGGRD